MSKRRPRVPRTLTKPVSHIDEHPDGSEVIHLTDDGLAMLEELNDSFREKFGRDPRPDDPLFFDPDADEPVPVTAEKMRRVFLEAAAQAGLDSEKALATWEWLGSDEHRAELRRQGVRRRVTH